MIWEAKRLVPAYLSWRSERFVEVWLTKMQSAIMQMESVVALCISCHRAFPGLKRTLKRSQRAITAVLIS